MCSRVNSILGTPPLVQIAGLILCVFSTKCFILSNCQFSKLPRTDIKIPPIVLAFVLPTLSSECISTREVGRPSSSSDASSEASSVFIVAVVAAVKLGQASASEEEKGIDEE